MPSSSPVWRLRLPSFVCSSWGKSSVGARSGECFGSCCGLDPGTGAVRTVLAMVLGAAVAGSSGCSNSPEAVPETTSSQGVEVVVPRKPEPPPAIVIQTPPINPVPAKQVAEVKTESPEACPTLPPALVLVCLVALGIALVALCFLLREPSAEDLCQELMEQSAWLNDEAAADTASPRTMDELLDPRRQ